MSRSTCNQRTGTVKSWPGRWHSTSSSNAVYLYGSVEEADSCHSLEGIAPVLGNGWIQVMRNSYESLHQENVPGKLEMEMVVVARYSTKAAVTFTEGKAFHWGFFKWQECCSFPLFFFSDETIVVYHLSLTAFGLDLWMNGKACQI